MNSMGSLWSPTGAASHLSPPITDWASQKQQSPFSWLNDLRGVPLGGVPAPTTAARHHRTAAARCCRNRSHTEQVRAVCRVAAVVRTTEALLTTALSVAGGLANVTRLDQGVAPGPLQRAPVEFLQLLVTQTESAEQELQRRADRISEAETALNLARAENEIESTRSVGVQFQSHINSSVILGIRCRAAVWPAHRCGR